VEPILKVALLGLAGWRMAALVSYERGPFDIFLRFRELLGIEHDSGGEPTVWPEGFLPRLVSCVWCLGFYTVLAAWGLWVLEPTLVYLLAAATLVVVTEKVARG
jgi:hypothetical protein